MYSRVGQILKFGDFLVVVQLIHRPTRTKISCTTPIFNKLKTPSLISEASNRNELTTGGFLGNSRRVFFFLLLQPRPRDVDPAAARPEDAQRLGPSGVTLDRVPDRPDGRVLRLV